MGRIGTRNHDVRMRIPGFRETRIPDFGCPGEKWGVGRLSESRVRIDAGRSLLKLLAGRTMPLMKNARFGLQSCHSFFVSRLIDRVKARSANLRRMFMSTAIRMQKAHKLTLATATESDISGIRNLIATQRIYDLIARSGATSSDKGFLFANLSEREWFKLINDEYVWVVKNGNQVSGVLLATKASSNKYEKLPKPKTTWTSPRIRTIYESDDFLYLWIISVHSDVQGMGVGKRLLSGLVEKARLEGVSVIIADFMSFPVLNRQSQRFFQSSGFYAGGELSIADYYGAGNSLWDIYYYDLARD